MNRSKRAAINTVSAVLNMILKIIIPFVLRTLMIYQLGEKFTGLGGLFTSLLTVLNLAELGFGNAVVFFMYKPMGEHLYEDVSKLLKFIRKAFLYVGVFISAVGLIICPFVDRFINGTLPQDINIYALYLLYLLNTVASYFFGGYNRTVLQAGQRNDIVSNIDSFIYIGTSIIQILVLWLIPNYYLYVIWLPIGAIMTNLIISKYARRNFPYVIPNGDIEENKLSEIVNKVKSLFLLRIGNIVFTSTDNIVISAFLGLECVTYYGNYYRIMDAVFALTYSTFGAITPVIANKINQCSKRESLFFFETIQFWVCIVSGIFFSAFDLLAQPFMEIWMGQQRMLDDTTVFLLGTLFYILQVRRAVVVMYDAQGLWDKSPWAQLVCGILNLSMSIFLVQHIGINGIIFGTIISIITVSFPWELYVVFNKYFDCGIRAFIIQNSKYLVATLVNTYICWFLIRMIALTGFIGIIANAFITVLICAVISYLLWKKTEYYKYGLVLIKNIKKK